MNLRKCMVAALAAVFSGIALCAQTDVTGTYLANPSFEADANKCNASTQVVNDADGLRGYKVTPTGWTVATVGTDLLITSECFTDNNFGKTAIADGEYAFYQRVGWTTASSSIKQSTSVAVAPGDYELSFLSKGFCANGAASTASYSVRDAQGNTLGENSFTCAAGSTGIMASSNWDRRSIKFRVAEPQVLTVAVNMQWQSGGSCIALDNFRLTQLPDGALDPDGPEIEGGTEDEVSSPTEGHLGGAFVSEQDMQAGMLQMLANFTQYCKNIYVGASNTSKGEACGYFKGNSAGHSNEDGVRTNADLAMVCAFVYRYGQPRGVQLPGGITYANLKDMATKALIYGYSTHKANKFLKTTNNAYWGSVSKSDNVWESSLWAMSLAYASYFLADDLTAAQKEYVYNMIKAECNYELERNIPTGYNGDTKAEENGWEADILACALGLYPNDALATQWFDRLRAFAINSYSQIDDANDDTVIDPDYDNKTVADYYLGACLYPDYTLQNHNYFHTSYQNVVMQELGEAHLAMALFQGSNPKWKTNALMHNNKNVMDNVLRYLALSDGELAMPNGNDWSMFLFDQITSYSTMACFLGDADALMLENLAYKNIKARQTTTTDGSWLLNSDIGPRRMGVEAHRVMMSYLMHDMASTANITPTNWDDFQTSTQDAKLFRSQNIVRASTPDRYTIFSWSAGLGNYTGYFVPNNPELAKIVVPYKANKTGNMLGWYNVDGKSTDASPVINGIYELNGNSWVMNGKLNTNGGTLENNFAIYSTPGNAVVYIDYVKGLASGTISKEYGGLLAISVDPFLKAQRTIYHAGGRFQSDGSSLKSFASSWVNVDNAIGVIVSDPSNNMAFGERGLSNSIYVAKLLTSYSNKSQAFQPGQVVDKRGIVYFSDVTAEQTKQLGSNLTSLSEKVADGWNGLIVVDADGTNYIIVANFCGDTSCPVSAIKTNSGAPVFSEPTSITADGSSVIFRCDVSHSIAAPIHVFVADGSSNVTAVVDKENPYAAIISATDSKDGIVNVSIAGVERGNIALPAGKSVKVWLDGDEIKDSLADNTGAVDAEDYIDVTDKVLKNNSFELDKTWSTLGAITLNNVVYDPCYVQDVAPVDTKWPQVLPVEGWEPAGDLGAATNYCLLYSMPYSATMYCVSPSSLGNSASIMAAPAHFAEVGDRCLSVLNSWTTGTNAVRQTVKLPEGKYKLKFVGQYVCQNEMMHQGDDVITTSSANVNYSLCGVSFGDNAIYRFPSIGNTWEEIVIPFELSQDAEVAISLGVRNTTSVGAANLTRLYIDDVRLFSEIDIEGDGIQSVSAEMHQGDVYNLQGMKVRVAGSDAQLPAGIYIINGAKVLVK